MRPPSAAQSRAVAVAPAPRGFPVVACPESIARHLICLLLTHMSIKADCHTDGNRPGRTGGMGRVSMVRSAPRSERQPAETGLPVAKDVFRDNLEHRLGVTGFRDLATRSSPGFCDSRLQPFN